jgi:HAMP domain-containing protein
MGIRSKLMYGFLTLAAMLFLAGILSIVEFRHMGQSVENLLDENYATIASSQRMIESIDKCNNGILLILVGKAEEGNRIIESSDTAFSHNLIIVRSHINQKGEDSIINMIDTLYSSSRKIWFQHISGMEDKNKLDWYVNTADKSFSALTQKIESLANMKNKSIYNTTLLLKNKAKRAVMPGIVAIIAALVFSIIFNYFINYYFVSPIIKISKGINDYSAYGIPFKVNIETNDELMDLKNSVENMVNKSRLEKI